MLFPTLVVVTGLYKAFIIRVIISYEFACHVINPNLKTWLFNHNSNYCTLCTPKPAVETPTSKKYATLDTLNALTPVVETGLNTFQHIGYTMTSKTRFKIKS